jgi:hypothetical protein
MPKTSHGRWKGWRVTEQGRNVKSNPLNDEPSRNQAPVTVTKMAEKDRLWKMITARRDDTCAGCGNDVRKGTRALWCKALQKLYCLACGTKNEITPR